jgi:hypothetical protein
MPIVQGLEDGRGVASPLPAHPILGPSGPMAWRHLRQRRQHIRGHGGRIEVGEGWNL